MYRAPATGLSITPAGNLLLLFAAIDGTFGLLIDPATMVARPLTWRAGSERARRGVGGARGIVRGTTFLQVLGDDLNIFRLEPAP